MTVDVVDMGDVDEVVPAARVSSCCPPLHAARTTNPRGMSVRLTLLVSLAYGPARDARAPGGGNLRPAAGHRPGGRGRGLRRLLPLRSSDALRPGGPAAGPDALEGRLRAHGQRDDLPPPR